MGILLCKLERVFIDRNLLKIYPFIKKKYLMRGFSPIGINNLNIKI